MAFSPHKKRVDFRSHTHTHTRHTRCENRSKPTTTTETRWCHPEPSHRCAKKNVEGIWIRDVVFRAGLCTRVEFEAPSQSSPDSYLSRDAEDVIHRERGKHVATDEEEKKKKKRENERDKRDGAKKRTRRADDDRYFRRDWFRRQTLD